MEKLYTVRKIRLRADCGSDHEILIAKFRLKLKKVGETVEPFKYDLNQVLYDYTMEVTNRFKGLYLRDKVLKSYGQRFITLYRRRWSRPCPRKRNAKQQNGCLRRPYKWLRKVKGKGEKERYPFECRAPKNSKER